MLWFLYPIILILVIGLIFGILYYKRSNGKLNKFFLVIFSFIILLLMCFVINFGSFDVRSIKVLKRNSNGAYRQLIISDDDKSKIKYYYDITDINVSVSNSISLDYDYKITFDDYNVIYMDSTNSEYARIYIYESDKYSIIRIPQGFKDYIVNIK